MIPCKTDLFDVKIMQSACHKEEIGKTVLPIAAQRRGSHVGSRKPLLHWLLNGYFDIAVMVAFRTLRVNRGLWMPLLPSYFTSR